MPRIKKTIESIWDNVLIQESGCWNWGGSFSGNGYGQFWFDNKQHPAHRISYKLSKGDIPEGMKVCHTCDNPKCINPEHLFLGNNAENMQDCVKKGRHPSKPLNIHPSFGSYKRGCRCKTCVEFISERNRIKYLKKKVS